MPWIIALGAGAGAAAGGGLSGLFGSSAAKKQVEAMREAIAENRRQYDETVGRMAPYLQFGTGRLNAFNQWLNDTSNNPAAGYIDPGFEFRRQEAMKGLTGNAATAGMLQSGDTLRAIEQYGQDLSAGEYGNAFNRWLAQHNAKMAEAAVGQNAAANLGTLGVQSAAVGGNIAANTDWGGPERVWGDVAGGMSGLAANALARYLANQQQKTPMPKVPGGSNVLNIADDYYAG